MVVDPHDLAQRMLGRIPAGSTLQVGHALAEAELGQPTKHEFCCACGIDLFTNPGVRILSIPDDPRDPLLVQCDCGRTDMDISKWLFR